MIKVRITHGGLLYLVDEEGPDDEGGEHDSRWMISLPDLDVDVMLRHVVLSSEHWDRND